MKIAIIHPWFLSHGGAEQTVAVLSSTFPDADIFTFLYEDEFLPPSSGNRKVVSLETGWVPAKYKLYRFLMPFYPTVFESFDLRGYDVVITSDSCVIKGILTDQKTTHICYCHSPMRSLYDQYWDYYYQFPKLVRPYFAHVSRRLRTWDFAAAARVSQMVANSRNIADRIRKYYNLDSTVIYPPVDTHKGYIDSSHDDYYLFVGRITASKRIELLIEACNRLQRRLVIAGDGRDKARLQKLSTNVIEFPGRVSDSELSRLYAQCRALLFAADEDFGIVPVEAQSYGRPVIAYGSGGCLETVIDSVTGVHFPEQTPESLAEAILRFEAMEARFEPTVIQQHSRKFDTEIFQSAMRALVANSQQPA